MTSGWRAATTITPTATALSVKHSQEKWPLKSICEIYIINNLIREKISVADPGCLSRIPHPSFFHSGSRIRVFSIPDPGSEFFPFRIPDPNFSIPDPGSWICIKEFKDFNPKNLFLISRKYDTGCSSRISGS
jgi:hypothetical protein